MQFQSGQFPYICAVKLQETRLFRIDHITLYHAKLAKTLSMVLSTVNSHLQTTGRYYGCSLLWFKNPDPGKLCYI